MLSHTVSIALAVALTCAVSAEAAKLRTLATIPGHVDGTYPRALVNVGGTLYGTTLGGGLNAAAGSQEAGTIFAIDPSTGSETVVYSFLSSASLSNPDAQLLNVGGLLYGVTNSIDVSGPNSILLSFNPATDTLASLYALAGDENSHPDIPLIQIGSLLYGTSCLGGSNSLGYVFSFDPSSNAVTTLYSFAGAPGDGSFTGDSDGGAPTGGLAPWTSGRFLGTTSFSNTAVIDGTVFSLRP
jgi:uncharacterized repeat protein (TIGR03803 family)